MLRWIQHFQHTSCRVSVHFCPTPPFEAVFCRLAVVTSCGQSHTDFCEARVQPSRFSASGFGRHQERWALVAPVVGLLRPLTALDLNGRVVRSVYEYLGIRREK